METNERSIPSDSATSSIYVEFIVGGCGNKPKQLWAGGTTDRGFSLLLEKLILDQLPHVEWRNMARIPVT
jgi:hypothetical protein